MQTDCMAAYTVHLRNKIHATKPEKSETLTCI